MQPTVLWAGWEAEARRSVRQVYRRAKKSSVFARRGVFSLDLPFNGCPYVTWQRYIAAKKCESDRADHSKSKRCDQVRLRAELPQERAA